MNDAFLLVVAGCNRYGVVAAALLHIPAFRVARGVSARSDVGPPRSAVIFPGQQSCWLCTRGEGSTGCVGATVASRPCASHNMVLKSTG